jgi:hypothetical protein
MHSFANGLYQADTKEQVTEIIGNIETRYDCNWEPLGGNPGNASTVDNQTGNSIVALAELIVNSFDSILLKNFNQKEHAGKFSTVSEAAPELISEEDEVRLKADGDKSNINFSVTDTGCGQPRGNFENTLLGLQEAGRIKMQYDFLQGQYGMGSTGSIHFSSKHGNHGRYKFVASASHESEKKWSWSIIRRNKNKNWYEYLKIQDQIPTFDGEFASKKSGTVTKVFDYRLNVGKGRITEPNVFRRRLQRVLFDPPMAISLEDARSGHKNTIRGHRNRIEGMRSDYLKKKIPINCDFESSGFGNRDVNAFVLKSRSEIEASSETNKERRITRELRDDKYAVLYLVNGQVHGYEPLYFTQSKCGLDQIGKDVIVTVDFSDVAGGMEMSEHFQPTRDRMKDTEKVSQMKNELAESISTNQWLIEEEERRLEKEIANSNRKDAQSTRDAVQDWVDTFPQYAKYLGGDGELSGRNKRSVSRPERNFSSPATSINPIVKENWASGDAPDISHESTYTFDIDEDTDTAHVNFFVDAPDDYFQSEENATLRLLPPNKYVSSSLADGVLQIRLKTETTLSSESMSISIHGENGEIDNSKFELNYVSSESSDSEPPEPNKEPSGDIPEFRTFTQSEWEENGYDAEKPIRLKGTKQEDSISEGMILINLGTPGLQSFLSEFEIQKESQDKVTKRFVRDNVIYSMALYRELESVHNPDKAERPLEELVEAGMKGVANTVLSQSISKKEIEKWSVN